MRSEAAERTIELHRDGWKAGSPLPEQVEANIPSPRRAAPRLAGGPDQQRARVRVPRGDLELKSGRRQEGPVPDRGGLPLVHLGGISAPDNLADQAVVALAKVKGNARRHHSDGDRPPYQGDW